MIQLPLKYSLEIVLAYLTLLLMISMPFCRAQNEFTEMIVNFTWQHNRKGHSDKLLGVYISNDLNK